MRTDLYKRYRFPTEIISHCVWLYYRFGLSFRAVEEMMSELGVVLSYETVRRWCLKFGSEYARRLKRRKAQPGDKWHLDEVFLNIGGERRYLWRAVDQVGNTLDILVTSKRDKRAAKRFLRKLLRDNAKPRVVVSTNYEAMAPCLKNCCPTPNIVRAVTLITELRTRTRGLGNENGRCNVSSRPLTPSAFCLSSNR